MASFRRKIFFIGGAYSNGSKLYRDLITDEFLKWCTHHSISYRISTTSPSSMTIENINHAVETNFAYLSWNNLLPNNTRKKRHVRAWQILRATKNFLFEKNSAAPNKFLGALTLLLSVPAIFCFALFSSLVILILSVAGIMPLLVSICTLLLIWTIFSAGFARHVDIGFMRFLIFSDRWALNKVNAVNGQIATFAHDIEAALNEPWDEILLVGHSHGTSLVVPVLKNMLRVRRNGLPAKFSVITMGNMIPILLGRNDAKHYRYDMNEISDASINWFDIGSARDRSSFYRSDMLAMSGGSDGHLHIRPISARLHVYFGRHQIKRSFKGAFRFSMLYLMTGNGQSKVSFPAIIASNTPFSHVVKDLGI